MTRRSRTVAALSIAALCLTAAPASAELVDVGKVRVRKDFKYANQTHEKGRYTVQLDVGTDTYIVISRDGEEVLREMAISIGDKKTMRRARVGYSLLAKDNNPRLRLAIRHGSDLHLAFFEVPE